MRRIILFLLCPVVALASPREDLASPSQQVRDDAARELRKTFILPPRKAWDELVAAIKPGDTKASVLERLRPFNATPGMAAGSGQTSIESYRLDDAWVLWVSLRRLDATKSEDEAKAVIKANLQEDIHRIWVAPPEHFTGIWTTYFVNGQRSHEVHYADGRYSGKFTAFYSDGSKACVQHYGPTGAEGEDTGYFPSGKIRYRGLYKDGKRVGTWTHYNEDGSVQSTEACPGPSD